MSEPTSTTDIAHRSPALFLLACAVVYGLIVWLLLPSLDYGPVPLDDRSNLSALENQPFSSLWHYDQFGHFRPLKNVLFWGLQRALPDLTLWRAGILAIFLATVYCVQRGATRVAESKWVGLATATLWAVHPTSASVVCWLSTANVSLSVLGLLTFMACFEGAAHAGAHARTRGSVLFVLGLLALSISMLSHDLGLLGPMFWLSERLIRRRAIERRLLVGPVATAALYLLARVLTENSGPAYRFEAVAPAAMAFSAARYFLQNSLLWLFPLDRFGVLLRDRPDEHFVLSAACWLILIGAAIAIWRLRHRDRVLTLGAAWFALGLAPFCNFVPLGNTPVAVHYPYLAGIGLSLFVARCVALSARRIAAGRASLVRALSALAIAAVAGLYLFEARSVVAAWGDPELLFVTTHDNYPHEPEALVNLSVIYLDRGQLADADDVLTKAAEIDPDDLLVLRNRISLAFERKDHQGVLDLLARRPTLAKEVELLIIKGEALESLNRHLEAARAYQLALEAADPDTESDHRYHAGRSLIFALLRAERPEEAAQRLVRLISEYPDRPELRQIESLLR